MASAGTRWINRNGRAWRASPRKNARTPHNASAKPIGPLRARASSPAPRMMESMPTVPRSAGTVRRGSFRLRERSRRARGRSRSRRGAECVRRPAAPHESLHRARRRGIPEAPAGRVGASAGGWSRATAAGPARARNRCAPRSRRSSSTSTAGALAASRRAGRFPVAACSRDDHRVRRDRLTVRAATGRRRRQAPETRVMDPDLREQARHVAILGSRTILDGVNLKKKLDREQQPAPPRSAAEAPARAGLRLPLPGVSAVVVYEKVGTRPARAGTSSVSRRSCGPRGYEVVPIAAPSAIEKSRHYLWPFWRALLRRGHLSTIFDRSWAWMRARRARRRIRGGIGVAARLR